jgi:DNA/RNA endonuclease G (NUC1)
LGKIPGGKFLLEKLTGLKILEKKIRFRPIFVSMKKLITILSLFLFLETHAQTLRDSVFVKTSIYSCVYSEILQQPKRVWYTVQCPLGSYPRKGMDFYTNDSIKTSDGKDYEANVWDKGHCAPAADFNCDRERLWATFSYLNCVLQHERLNRGAWRLLEVRERELSKSQSVEVEIKMVYSKTSVKLPTGATIPDGFLKTIKYGKTKEVYYFKNEDPGTTDYLRFKK